MEGRGGEQPYQIPFSEMVLVKIPRLLLEDFKVLTTEMVYIVYPLGS